jgi:hypothetical protein
MPKKKTRQTRRKTTKRTMTKRTKPAKSAKPTTPPMDKVEPKVESEPANEPKKKKEFHSSLDADVLLGEHEMFVDRNKVQLWFVSFHKPCSIVAWEDNGAQGGGHKITCHGIRLHHGRVRVAELKRLKLWSKIPKEWQAKIDAKEKELDEQKRLVTEVLDNGDIVTREPKRRGRRANPLYEGLPKQMTCTECGDVRPVAQKLIYERITASGEDREAWLAGYIKTFKCGKCGGRGRRGRPANPAYADIPKELVCCKCNEPKKTTPPQFLKQLKKSGMEQDEYLASYICRSCRGKIRRGELDE